MVATIARLEGDVCVARAATLDARKDLERLRSEFEAAARAAKARLQSAEVTTAARCVRVCVC